MWGSTSSLMELAPSSTNRYGYFALQQVYAGFDTPVIILLRFSPLILKRKLLSSCVVLIHRIMNNNNPCSLIAWLLSSNFHLEWTGDLALPGVWKVNSMREYHTKHRLQPGIFAVNILRAWSQWRKSRWHMYFTIFYWRSSGNQAR